MKSLFLFFFVICRLNAVNSRKITLEPENWIGMGFFMSLYPEYDKTQHYKDCFSDEKLFMALPLSSWQGEVLAAAAWVNKNTLLLRTSEQKEVWCRTNNKGIIPELVFFKDLLDAEQLYRNKEVWAKVDFFHIPDNQRRGRRYPLRKFESLRVIGAEPAPASEHNSVRIFCRVQRSSMEGYFDVSLTGVNRIPPLKNFNDYCFLENPEEIYQMDDKVWAAAQEGRVITGTPPEIAEILLGPPQQIREDRGDILRFFYNSGRNKRQEYIFFRKKLIKIINSQDDEFPESRLF